MAIWAIKKIYNLEFINVQKKMNMKHLPFEQVALVEQVPDVAHHPQYGSFKAVHDAQVVDVAQL